MARFVYEKEMNSFYMRLWGDLYDIDADDLSSLVLPVIPTHINDFLTRDFSMVKQIVASISTGKAHGPDGFNMEFYTTYCNIVGDSIFKAFSELRLLARQLGHDISVFYSGVSGKSVRSQSYLLVSYRILSKLLATRLAPYLNSIVGLEQSAFIKGRSITDNVMLVQEIAHSLSVYKRNKTL